MLATVFMNTTQHPKHTINLGSFGQIIISAGAFGSGEHETTDACLDIMKEIEIHGKRVLDVGCGTGILSIAAAKMGAEKVVGFDISQQAVEISDANASLNGTAETCEFIHGDASAVGGMYDIIIANIYQDIIIDLRDYFLSHLNEGGLLLLSGIPIEYDYDVRRVYERKNFFSLSLTLGEDFITVLLSQMRD